MSSNASAAPLTQVKNLYFDLPIAGRGGGVELFLAAAGVPFEREGVAYDDTWAALKAKLSAPGGANPLGHLPLLYVNGAPEPLIDSHASTRYVARLLGLYGKDAERDYRTDVVASAAAEWRTELLSAFFGGVPAVKEAYLAPAAGKRVHFYAAAEELLGRFGAQGATTVGGSAEAVAAGTFADGHLFALVYDDVFLTADRELLARHPRLAAFHDAFAALPGPAQWLRKKQQSRA